MAGLSGRKATLQLHEDRSELEEVASHCGSPELQLTGDLKLEWLKLLLFLNCRFGSLAVRMLSTGKTAWCLWAPLALLALLPLSLTQAQTQGKGLLFSFLTGAATSRPALADVRVDSVQNITC